MTNPNNTALQSLKQSQNVDASKQNKGSNPEVPHTNCLRSQNIFQDIQKTEELF